MAKSDVLTFIKRFAANPGRIGAIAPSGAALAKAICAEITPALGPIVEFGPGTGVFTQALLGKGIAPRNLTLFEADADFARLLRLRFPDVNVVHADIAELQRRNAGYGIEAGALVSGLPLLAIRQDDVRSILEFGFAQLRRGGAMYQFSYRPKCPVPASVMTELQLTSRRVGTVMRNLPPAFVFKLEKARNAP